MGGYGCEYGGAEQKVCAGIVTEKAPRTQVEIVKGEETGLGELVSR